MKKSLIALVALGLLSVSFPALAAELPSHPLIEKARRTQAKSVQYASDNGVKAGLTADGKSYYLLWFPEGTGPENLPPMVVTMHGHGGCAFVDFFVWHKFLKKRGYGLLAVQWWVGETEKTNDYLLPNEIYRAIDDVFKKLRVKSGTALLHGFSRGSANIYPVAAMDRSLKNNYFSLFIANAGRANSDYPPVGEIERGKFGDKPFEGSHWVTYAGGKDTNPDRDGIQGMREAGAWIQKYGGTLDLAIEDPNSGHGGFHMNPKNTEAALDVFDKLRSQ